MSQPLPPNFINISVADLNEALNQGLDFTSAESLLKLWKAYAAASAFIDDHAAPRIRNLFWRLLNSPQTAEKIDSLKLAVLWQRCQEEQPFSPFQLPERYGRSVEIQSFSNGSSEAETIDRSSGRIWNTHLRPESGTRSGPSPRQSQGSAGSYDRSNVSPRTSTSTVGSASGRPVIRRNTSSRGRGVTVASSGRGRARPSLPRRRSSQTRLQHNPAQISPRPGPQSPASAGQVNEATEMASRPREAQPRAGPATFTLPSASSWQSDDDVSEQSAPPGTATAPSSGPLVDRDFRRNFVDNQRQMASATNLAGLARGRRVGSSVRFDEVPEVIGEGKGRERAQSPTRGSPEARRQLQRSDSQVLDDSDEDSDGVSMPRVQSNLSTLIKKGRQQSGSNELPPPPTEMVGQGQSAAARKKDEEILKMGRNAAAPNIPKGRPGSNIAQRFRSPSPGATF